MGIKYFIDYILKNDEFLNKFLISFSFLQKEIWKLWKFSFLITMQFLTGLTDREKKKKKNSTWETLCWYTCVHVY